jgi:hypothetical protein
MADAQSSSSTRSGAIRAEFRILMGLLAGKEVILPANLEARIMRDNMSKISGIVSTLCDHPESIQKVEIMLADGDSIVKRDRKRTADNATEAKFDLSVVHCASFSEKGVPSYGPGRDPSGIKIHGPIARKS